jgi:hypothetical protein
MHPVKIPQKVTILNGVYGSSWTPEDPKKRDQEILAF